MSTRIIEGLDGMARAFERMALEEHAVISESIGVAAHIVKKHVDEAFGDKTKLAELSPYTVAERESLGYSPDEPLLRDGSLLRDKVELEHHGFESGVGSAEPIQVYSEMGWVNSRTGRSVPPRAVFRIALHESEPKIMAVIDEAVEMLVNGRAIPREPEE